MPADITFRPLSAADLPLFHAWRELPHVAAWWPREALDEVEAEYGPLVGQAGVLPLDSIEGTIPYLAYEGDTPFAYIQAYRVMAHQEGGWWPDERDPCALGVDQFIGPPDRLGQGLGTALLQAFLALLFADPRVTSVQTDPSPANGRAIACYRKAGFRDVGLVATPDGEELLLRATRP